jgi:hypothetical protein
MTSQSGKSLQQRGKALQTESSHATSCKTAEEHELQCSSASTGAAADSAASANAARHADGIIERTACHKAALLTSTVGFPATVFATSVQIGQACCYQLCR